MSALAVIGIDDSVLVAGDARELVCDLPDGVCYALIRLQRSTSFDSTFWSDEGARLSVSIDVSFDGEEWERVIGVESSGGVAYDQQAKAELQWLTGTAEWASSAHPKKARVRIESINAEVRTAGYAVFGNTAAA